MMTFRPMNILEHLLFLSDFFKISYGTALFTATYRIVSNNPPVNTQGV
jgi:hypothetical protein